MEHPYREGYAGFLKGQIVENDVEHMWEQMKRALVESAREVSGLVRVGERTQRVFG